MTRPSARGLTGAGYWDDARPGSPGWLRRKRERSVVPGGAARRAHAQKALPYV